jgi:hypothetical protein
MWKDNFNTLTGVSVAVGSSSQPFTLVIDTSKTSSAVKAASRAMTVQFLLIETIQSRLNPAFLRASIAVAHTAISTSCIEVQSFAIETFIRFVSMGIINNKIKYLSRASMITEWTVSYSPFYIILLRTCLYYLVVEFIQCLSIDIT